MLILGGVGFLRGRFVTFCGGSLRVVMGTVDFGPYALTERRIARLTLVLGGIASAGGCFSVLHSSWRRGPDWGAACVGQFPVAEERS